MNDDSIDPAQENTSTEVFNSTDAESQLVDNQQTDQTQQTQQQQQQTPTQNIDVKQLVDALRSAQPQQQKVVQQQAPLTQDQIDERLGRVKLTPEMFKGMLGVDGTSEQIKNMQNVFDQVARYAITSAYTLQQRLAADNQAAIAKVNDQISPLNNYYMSQREEQLKGEFFKQNPDLKDYEPIAKEIYESMVAKGMKYDSVEAAFSAVATNVRNVLSKLGISQNNGTVQRQNPQQVNTGRRMASTGFSGNVGGGGTQQPSAKSESLSVFN